MGISQEVSVIFSAEIVEKIDGKNSKEIPGGTPTLIA